jgi:hypothetical protein
MTARRSKKTKPTKAAPLAKSASDSPADPAQKQRLSFSGHQTFTFRYSWLPKGVKEVKEDPTIFFREDALVELGVGKNMVDSIRFWCEATDLITVDGRERHAEVRPLGALLFGKNKSSDAMDPYLEDPGTLWLLHWKLSSRITMASTWHYAFTRWNRNVFTKDQLVKWIFQVAQQSSASKSSESSIQRDVEVFLRTYVPVASGDGRRPIEDSFDCPLGELGLIRQLEEGYYQFGQGPKPSLPSHILAYALLEYWNLYANAQESINLERILYDPGSPGAAFKLDDAGLIKALEGLPKKCGIRYDETAGLRVLQRESRKAFKDPSQLLDDYYSLH